MLNDRKELQLELNQLNELVTSLEAAVEEAENCQAPELEVSE